jgi:hypothetical protein
MMHVSKYPKALIKRIADEIGSGMICFLNADTLEIDSVLGFQNFKIIIDNSPYRQCWFDFKQSRLEQFVAEQLDSSEEAESQID